MDLHEQSDDNEIMYEVTCPATGEIDHLDHTHVLSSHRVSTGHVVYLRCPHGGLVVWTTPPATVPHPIYSAAA